MLLGDMEGDEEKEGGGSHVTGDPRSRAGEAEPPRLVASLFLLISICTLNFSIPISLPHSFYTPFFL